MELKKRTKDERIAYIFSQYFINNITLETLKLQLEALSKFEEKNTLLEKSVYIGKITDREEECGFYFDDVKEALKEFIKRCQYDDKIKVLGLDQVAKEIFGERLI